MQQPSRPTEPRQEVVDLAVGLVPALAVNMHLHGVGLLAEGFRDPLQWLGRVELGSGTAPS
jgi:hypothetical protein